MKTRKLRRDVTNCPIHISGGFCILAAWFTLASGWRALSIILSAAILHECGHFIALRLNGAKIRGLSVGICGAVLETDCTRLSYERELLCVLAGPAVNFLAAIITASKWSTFAGANFILCLFNLLPIQPLDGGRMLYLLISWRINPITGEDIARWIGMTTAAVIALGAGYLMWQSGGSLWLLPAISGLLFSAFLSTSHS